MKAFPLFAAAVITVAGTAVPGRVPSTDKAPAAQIKTFTQNLPSLRGDQLRMSVVEVTYPPGASSPPHSHPCPVVVHVEQGSVEMQVRGEPRKTYGEGESFYEAPNGAHVVSANASRTQAAKFVAVFLCDRDTPLSVPVSGAPSSQ